jgi:FMN-dependent oxidoreductase (nitrilotriacetate monooxygenase family)
MVLTAFLMPTGYFQGAWRKPGSRAEEIGSVDYIADLAGIAERAKLDAVFFGDVVSADTVLDGNINSTGLYEPLTTLAAIAARTSRIGLIGTISTTFSLPFVTARQLSGLDSLSGGRAGWNIVTSWIGNENFGLDELPPAAERYRRAREFVDVAVKLWDSWQDDAVVVDRERGVWADPSRIHPIDHHGEFYSVRGPLNVPRSPQGHPILVQAGSSADGIDLGASVAEVIYTAQPWKHKAIAFREHFRNVARSKGRNPDHVKILPGIVPIVAETDAEAQALADDLNRLIDFDLGKRQLADQLKLELRDVGLDQRVPVDRFPQDPEKGSRYEIFRRLSTDDGLTLRQLIVESYRSGAHLSVIGSPATIAEVMIDWFDSGACDGFSLNAPDMPDGLERICTLLVPELRRRGYFRDEYSGETLRDHLGLPRPASTAGRTDRSSTAELSVPRGRG